MILLHCHLRHTLCKRIGSSNDKAGRLGACSGPRAEDDCLGCHPLFRPDKMSGRMIGSVMKMSTIQDVGCMHVSKKRSALR